MVSLSTVGGRLLRVEVVVIVSALHLAALVLHGTTRRPSSDTLLRSIIWMAYSLSYMVVSYAVGLIQDGPFHGETFVLWASALLLIQASAYAAPGQSRHDMSQRKKLLLQHVFQTGLVLWLVVNVNGRNTSYRATIWAFWSLNVVKTAIKTVEVIKASHPERSVRVVSEYMDVEESLAAGEQPPDPKTMAGYKYLFHGEDTMELSHEYGRLSREEIFLQSSGKSVVTIDQVYRWIDEQGYSDVEKDKAKHFCLAFTLFKLLKRRFYMPVWAETGSEKARNLVLTGLIPTTGPDAAFRVVEAELAFLYDFFYIRNDVLVGAWTYTCIAFIVLGLIMWTIIFGTFGPVYRRLQFGVPDLDRAITVVILVITASLELYQALSGFFNDWRYIRTVYRCVRDGRPWYKKRRNHLWWKESITPPETRYWENKIGEYVLLKQFRHRPLNLLSWLTLYLVEPRRQGQKRSRRKELPPQVRRAVLVSLKTSQGRLTNGTSALQRHGLAQLTWACRFPQITVQILVWHVVTTRCDWSSGPRRRGDLDTDGDGDGHRLVATKLSNYCAYLVAFVPEMLPDPSYSAEQIFDRAVLQARGHFVGCRTKEDILAQINKIEANEQRYTEALEGGAVYERAGSSTIIEKAALLGGQLGEAVGADGGRRRWEVLAEFWAELVLFLAPSGNVDIHAKILGAGGEFMTQLWTLLAHAGVLERPAVAVPA